LDPDLADANAAESIVSDMRKASYFVSSIKHGKRKKKAPAPFITSTLQQDASRKLGFSARKTMRIAQQLYEGIELDGQGTRGLITYMRTDSTNISPVAINEVRGYIKQRFGEDYLPEKPLTYKTRSRSAQEAHEAVRPTSIKRGPRNIKQFLSRDQFRLYQLIWERFVASQINPAIYETLAVEVEGKGNDHEYLLRASGRQLAFPGYLVIYEEGKDEDRKNGQEGDSKNIPIEDIK
jgi:DNA topoisomerase-1